MDERSKADGIVAGRLPPGAARTKNMRVSRGPYKGSSCRHSAEPPPLMWPYWLAVGQLYRVSYLAASAVRMQAKIELVRSFNLRSLYVPVSCTSPQPGAEQQEAGASCGCMIWSCRDCKQGSRASLSSTTSGYSCQLNWRVWTARAVNCIPSTAMPHRPLHHSTQECSQLTGCSHPQCREKSKTNKKIKSMARKTSPSWNRRVKTGVNMQPCSLPYAL